MVLGDCDTQELTISPLRFAVVDYGAFIPTSEELQRIIGCAQKGGSNVFPHLSAALVQSETAPNRSPPPASRVKLVA